MSVIIVLNFGITKAIYQIRPKHNKENKFITLFFQHNTKCKAAAFLLPELCHSLAARKCYFCIKFTKRLV